jgi:hypothetical protein
VGLRGRKSAFGTRRARGSPASFRSALTGFAVAFALLVQLMAMPYQQALAGPDFAGLDNAAVAAELQATFGDAAYLCVHIDDKSAPAPHGPCNHCDDQCPLCRSVAEAATFLPPDVPTLAARLDAARHAVRSAPDFAAFSACPAQTNRARAPPFDV